MKNIILYILLICSVNAVTLADVKYIDNAGSGNYAVTCTNGDKSGRIFSSNGQICANSDNLKTKCSDSWNNQSAATYLCNNSFNASDRKHYARRAAILCVNKKDIISKEAQDKGALKITRRFQSAPKNCQAIDKTNIIILKIYKNYDIPFAKIKDYRGTATGYIYLDDIIEY